MFRYAITLLLINAYFSLGLPVNINPVSLAVSLKNLGQECDNSFLKSEIFENMKYCNESIEPKSKKELMCLMFYDISSQLCASKSKQDLKEDYSKKAAENNDINALCDTAKTWTFSNLQDYPHYAQLIEMFKNQKKCSNVCAKEDLTSDSPNFYCHYFKWGTDILSAQKSVVKVPVDTSSVVQVDSKKDTVATTSTTANNLSKDAVEDTKINSNEKIKTPNIKEASEPNPPSGVVTEQKPAESVQPVLIPDITSNKDELKMPAEPVENVEAVKDDKSVLDPLNEKESAIENPRMKAPGADLDEDIEDDEDRGDDALSAPIGSDTDDGDEQNLNADPKLEFDKSKIVEKKIESITSFNGDISQKELFANSISDSFAEDDDHFFPFFMTAIILVVLLYILYHNKNKMTKLVLGLLVEGRQSGRRRNSRGHAYRRLDTLEQAMSSNTTAPPSKIIY